MTGRRTTGALGAAAIAWALACGGGSGGPATMDEARVLCAQRDPAGCLYLAKALEPDPDARTKHPEAWETYNDASCEAGLASACYEIGFIRLTGQGGRKDAAEAARLLGTGCDAGVGRACGLLAEQTYRGDGIPKDPTAARALFAKACDQGVFDGCVGAGRLTAEGEGGPADLDAAKAFYAKSCVIRPDHPLCKAP